MALRPRGRRRVTLGHFAVEIAGESVPVTVMRSALRRRTIAVAVGAGSIRVQAPTASRDDELLALLRRRAEWIAGRLQAARQAPAAAAWEDRSLVPYRGEKLTLRIETSSDRRAMVTRCGDQLLLQLPASTPEADRWANIQKAIEGWYRMRAAEVLPSLVSHWSVISALTPTGVLVRDQRRRWGSCSPDGTIRLNWRLVMLEPRLADYVVVHELAHLRHRHHQATFWDEVAHHIPDHRERRRELNAASGALGQLG